MTPEIRTQIVLTRSTDYYNIMRTTIFTLLGIAAVIEFGPGGYSAPLITLVITACAYGILAGGVALDDIINLRSDMDESFAQSGYGKGVAARNIPMLKNVSAGLLALVGLAEIVALVT